MYSDTITMFNRYVDGSGNTIWHPHIITDVNLQNDKAAIVAKYGAESKDNAILNVKYNSVNGIVRICDKTYLPPKEWKRQTEEVLAESITFNAGTDFDFFMLGDYGSEEPILDEKCRFYSDMQKEYDFVFAITSVSMFKTIPHFEIAGK